MDKGVFLMKNTLKLIGIIAFAAIMGLGFFTSCEVAEEDQAILLLSGIGTTYNGKYISVDIYPEGTDIGAIISASSPGAKDIREALAGRRAISGTTANIPLDNTKGKAFAPGNKKRYVLLVTISSAATGGDVLASYMSNDSRYVNSGDNPFDLATEFKSVSLSIN